jgi:hypothetical protein
MKTVFPFRFFRYFRLLKNDTWWLLSALIVFTVVAIGVFWKIGTRSRVSVVVISSIPSSGLINLRCLPNGAVVGDIFFRETSGVLQTLGVRIFRPKDGGFEREDSVLGREEIDQIVARQFPELKASPDFSRVAIAEDGSAVALSLGETGLLRNGFVIITLPDKIAKVVPLNQSLQKTSLLTNFAILSDGNLLVESEGRLVALEPKSGREIASSPKSFNEILDLQPIGRFVAVTQVVAPGCVVSLLDGQSLRTLVESNTFLSSNDWPLDETPYAASSMGYLAVWTDKESVTLSRQGSAALVLTAPSSVGPLTFLGENNLLAGSANGVYRLFREHEPELILATGKPVKSLAAGARDGGSYTLVYSDGSKAFVGRVRFWSPLAIVVSAWSALSVISIVLWFVRRRVMRRPAEQADQGQPPVGPALTEESYPASLRLPPPTVPRELVDACFAGECVLYAGAGLSAQSGLPTWHGLLSEMVEWAIRQEVVDGRLGNSLRVALQHGEMESVSEGLLDHIGSRVSALHEFLRETLLERATPSAVHQTLGRLPFIAVLTTNFDELLEKAFRDRSPPVFTPRDTEALLATISSREFFILKLYGNLHLADTVILSAAQYEEATTPNSPNSAFSSFMETLFFSRTILFLGARLEGIEDYLKGIKFSQTRPRTHYALVDVAASGPSWELKSNTLRRKYGIEVIPYAATDGHPQVREFVKELAEGVSSAKRKDQASTAPVAKGSLKRVILDNIGPFDHLELNLDPGWNVLLGDNGVGKSHILKAIAVAICGRDAKAYANRLIKVGAPLASIHLETDRGTIYKTELYPGMAEAEVVSMPVRPLEAEGWLAIGFPPSRMFSWERPKGPEARVERRPNPEDVLPLIRGGTDPRMDKLKQWLLNLDYWIKGAGENEEERRRFESLREEFFSVSRQLAIGTEVKYSGIEPQTFEVKVSTSDGTLPLEAISQGTAALIGWVGILIQRLYEVSDSSTAGLTSKPLERHALVLIDELDAHMHPAWQQAVIPLLKEIFPNVQFLATTHSPFLAVGRRASEIVRLRRDPATGKAIGESVEYDTTNMGIANVLTSYLFGLGSSLDYNLQQALLRKRRLSAKPDLNESELAELATLSERLKDVEATTTLRDPLYQRFVEEITRRQKAADAVEGKVTKEEEERQRRLTREILEDLEREKEARS